MMEAYSSSPLMETFSINRRFGSSPSLSPAASPTKTEVDFPIDVDQVDQSFNSSMSFSMADSPPPAPSPSVRLAKFNSMPHSPSPQLKGRRPALATKSFGGLGSVTEGGLLGTKPPTSARTFGRELPTNGYSLSTNHLAGPSKSKGRLLGSALPKSAAGVQTAPAPWHMPKERAPPPTSWEPQPSPRMGRRESAPTLWNASAVATQSTMDVDSPRHMRCGSDSPSISGSPGLGSYFCPSPAGAMEQPPAKRRNLIGSSTPASPTESTSMFRPQRGCEKTFSSNAVLLGGARANTLGGRRPAPYLKRPSVHPIAAPTDVSGRSSMYASANPILYGASRMQSELPTMRRAFSVCATVGDLSMTTDGGSDDEDDFNASPSVNVVLRRNRQRDPGSPGPGNCLNKQSEGEPKPEYMVSEISDRDREREGKILPCHGSQDDGLMRITPETLEDVLAGKYAHKMKRYHVIDCRFDYEYEGGHIAGAIHLRDSNHLREMLFTANSGINQDALPEPSTSGEANASEHVVLIFHCEYTRQRAPTFAGEARTFDRSITKDVYPKVHYPELYLLEGGYERFFKECPTRCDPQGYVQMDDKRYAETCDEKLHVFRAGRKMMRARSYTTGEKPREHKFAPLPLCPPMAIAAASAALGRRGGTAGVAIAEEHEHEHDLGSSPMPNASPCPSAPRTFNMGQPPIFASARPRTMTRQPFQRHVSCVDSMLTQYGNRQPPVSP